MDNREFIQRCIVSSTAFTGHDGWFVSQRA